MLMNHLISMSWIACVLLHQLSTNTNLLVFIKNERMHASVQCVSMITTPTFLLTFCVYHLQSICFDLCMFKRSHQLSLHIYYCTYICESCGKSLQRRFASHKSRLTSFYIVVKWVVMSWCNYCKYNALLQGKLGPLQSVLQFLVIDATFPVNPFATAFTWLEKQSIKLLIMSLLVSFVYPNNTNVSV